MRLAQLLEEFRLLRCVDVSAQLAERGGQHEQRDELGRERLGRRDNCVSDLTNLSRSSTVQA